MKPYDLFNRMEGRIFRGLGKSSLVPLFLVVKEIALSRYFSVFDCFHDVEIETTSICNRSCAYCPNAYLPREKAYMEQDLFEKIVKELAQINFAGNLNLHHFGEPLLDKRLPSLVAYARQRLPAAGIQIFTNGDFLTVSLFRELLESGVTRLFITSHCVYENGYFGTVMSPALKTFFSLVNPAEMKVIGYARIEPGSILANRPVTGSGPYRALPLNRFRHIVHCSYATRLLEVDYRGRILLCCQQQGAETGPVLGDLSKESIIEAWNRPEYRRLRNHLRRGKFAFEMCRQCGWGTWSPERGVQ